MREHARGLILIFLVALAVVGVAVVLHQNTKINQQSNVLKGDLSAICQRLNVERAQTTVLAASYWSALINGAHREEALATQSTGVAVITHTNSAQSAINQAIALTVKPQTNCAQAVADGDAYHSPRLVVISQPNYPDRMSPAALSTINAAKTVIATDLTNPSS